MLQAFLSKKNLSSPSTREQVTLLAGALAIGLSVFAILFPLPVGAVVARAPIDAAIRQAKCATSPTVYYLDQASQSKKPYLTQEIFLSYGNTWSDVRLVDCRALARVKDTRLVRLVGDDRVFWLAAGKVKHVASYDEITAAGLTWADVVAVNQTEFDFYWRNTQPEVGGQDTSISADTNKEVRTYAGATKAQLATFQVAAVGERLKLTTLELAVVDSDLDIGMEITNLKAYKGGLYQSDAVIGYQDGKISVSGLRITVSAGQEVDVHLRGDVSAQAAGQLRVQLVSAAGDLNKAGKKERIFNLQNLDVLSHTFVVAPARLLVEAETAAPAIAGQKDALLAAYTLGNPSAEELRLTYFDIKMNDCVVEIENAYLGTADAKGKITRIGQKLAAPISGNNRFDLKGRRLASGQELVIGLYADINYRGSGCNLESILKDVSASGSKTGLTPALDGVPTAAAVVSTGQAEASRLDWPISSAKINYYFHDSSHPFANQFDHNGIDFRASQGTVVRAAANGEVLAASSGEDGGYAYVEIQHSGNLTTIYGHLSRLDVKAGDRVKVGERIGLSGGAIGQTGSGSFSTGPHLHFEVKEWGVSVDPLNYIDK
jgi:murein DD-endopeptidase MepM/ murein hydrolase activator NlpD